VAAAVRLVRWVAGDRRTNALVARAEHHFVFSGWPTHPAHWINLHMSRFFQRLRRDLDGPRAPIAVVRARIRTGACGTLRVGCIGSFSGHLGMPAALFAAKPASVHLTVVDLPYRGASAPYLARIADAYVCGDLTSPDGLARTAAAVNDAALDLLINTDASTGASRLLDRAGAACVAHYCAGADLLYHPRISVQLHGQPQADYFVRDDRMFCGTSRTFLSDDLVVRFAGLYDRRGIAIGTSRPWRDREPLIVFHGSLYKVARPEVLATLLELVAADRAVQLVLVGKDRSGETARIQQAAARSGVSDRVRIVPPFSAMRDETGAVGDAGWTELCDLLSRARLAPDPWPVGGASSRLEAYALGAPSVHMGVRFDSAAWGKPQPSVTEVPHLLVPAGTARSAAEYSELARRCLYDEAFATALVAEQTAVAVAATDERGWWSQLLAAHARWEERRGAAPRN
jgi:hypothetical protein